MTPTLATVCAALRPSPMTPASVSSPSNRRASCHSRRSDRGFTLIELLVAISVMALLAVLSWRGLDGMARSQAQTSQRADEVLNLQAGLGQWKVDLDSLTQMQTPTPQVTNLAWDGRVLRLTRRATNVGDGLVVVAWTRRGEADGQWLRWQSPPVRTVGAWSDAWNRANVWSQTASAEDRLREVMITPLASWQLFYYRGNAWSNPLSSAGSGNLSSSGSSTAGNAAIVPDGIRLILELPPGQPVNGRITLDWVRPTLGGDR
jgi:general secretion pathway protein J